MCECIATRWFHRITKTSSQAYTQCQTCTLYTRTHTLVVGVELIRWIQIAARTNTWKWRNRSAADSLAQDDISERTMCGPHELEKRWKYSNRLMVCSNHFVSCRFVVFLSSSHFIYRKVSIETGIMVRAQAEMEYFQTKKRCSILFPVYVGSFWAQNGILLNERSELHFIRFECERLWTWKTMKIYRRYQRRTNKIFK